MCSSDFIQRPKLRVDRAHSIYDSENFCLNLKCMISNEDVILIMVYYLQIYQWMNHRTHTCGKDWWQIKIIILISQIMTKLIFKASVSFRNDWTGNPQMKISGCSRDVSLRVGERNLEPRSQRDLGWNVKALPSLVLPSRSRSPCPSSTTPSKFFFGALSPDLFLVIAAWNPSPRTPRKIFRSIRIDPFLNVSPNLSLLFYIPKSVRNSL